MLQAYMGQCAATAAFGPITSLNAPIPFEDDFRVEVGDLIPDLADDAECLAIKNNLIALVPDFLQTLTERQREIVVRYFWDGETQAEIASALGVTTSAISHALKNIAVQGREFFATSAN